MLSSLHRVSAACPSPGSNQSAAKDMRSVLMPICAVDPCLHEVDISSSRVLLFISSPLYVFVMSSTASASPSGTSALLLHCGAIPLINPRTKDQIHDLLRYLSGHPKPKLVRRRTSIFKLEQELLLNLNPKPKVEEIALQEHVIDAVISRRLVSFDKVATQGGMSRLGSHPASCGQIMRVYPLLGDGSSRHTHSSSIPASLHAMGFKTSPPELVTIRECEEYTIPYPRLPCDITASVYTLYKLKPGTPSPVRCLNVYFSSPAPGHVDSDIDITGKSSGLCLATLLILSLLSWRLLIAIALSRALQPACFCDISCSSLRARRPQL